jgi:hypothetical protein
MNSQKDLDTVLPDKIGGSDSLDTIFKNGMFNGQDRFSKSAGQAAAEVERKLASGKVFPDCPKEEK